MYHVYKCVIIYNGKILDTTIVMKNLSSNFNIQIKSKNGNKFYFGNGDTELICLINGKEEPTSYKYLWAEENNFGHFIPLVGNNNKYNVLIKSIIDYSNYKCSVYEGENFKGTVSIVIYNTLNIKPELCKSDGLWDSALILWIINEIIYFFQQILL